LDEALELRTAGINAPIHVLSYTSPCRVSDIVENRLIQTVYRPDLAEAISEYSISRGFSTPIPIHIKVDTGMYRAAMPAASESLDIVSNISRLPGVVVEGIMTHFATSDEPEREYTLRQLDIFLDFCDKLKRRGVNFRFKHTANSGAIVNFPESHLDIVRPGIVMYGLMSDKQMHLRKAVQKSVMSFKARVININQLNTDCTVSYGRTFRAMRPSVIATIAAGYADGYPRALSNKGRLIVKDSFAPVAGAVCMDHLMLDVTDMENKPVVGDEAVIFGSTESLKLAVDEVSGLSGTINYEIICGIGKRVPRVYIENGQISKIKRLY
ncbi:MAG: alanine racemase, partial [Clostridiales bacterium]|nr:alanine racemase [Clostridiales bacterium]